MKTKIKIIASLTLLFLATHGARAFIIFQDNFSYASQPGPIGAVSGGVWVAGAGNTLTSDIYVSNNLAQLAGSSPSDLPRAYFTNGLPGFMLTNAPNFSNTVSFFPSNAPVAALYASFKLNVPSVSGITNTYIAYFTDTNFDFSGRIFVVTNTATPGAFRMAIDNLSTPATPTNEDNILQQDLAEGTDYTVVVRYDLHTGQMTLWVNPVNEASTGFQPTGTVFVGGVDITSVSGTNTTVNSSICAYGLRNHLGGGPLTMGNLIVGTTFADVVPASAGQNPPVITSQPADASQFTGGSTSFSVIADGDATLGYQWRLNNTNLSDGLQADGSTVLNSMGSTLTLSSITTNEQGNYTVMVSNSSGSPAVSSNAVLTVITSPAAPAITTQPSNQVVTLAGTATFAVTATDGGPPLFYQWNLNGSPIPKQTNSTLELTAVTFLQGGANQYSVTVSNQISSTNSDPAFLTVNPPATVSIAFLRSLLDSTNFNTNGAVTLYSVKGTVTTWQNLTTSGNSEFFIQDGTAGITVFWSGAPASTNLPPAGAIVQVTAPLADFRGLLEIEPVFGNAFQNVTVLSTGNPLPAPQPLPFDPNITGNPALMQQHLVGSYFVASNVFLDVDSGPTFTSNANEPITNKSNVTYPLSIFNPTTGTNGSTSSVTVTNQNGETFILFYNSHTDLIGKTKPTGPVTIYGVLGVFVSNPPFTSGYEFTPSRFADIVPVVRWTNVLTHLSHYGDLLTNSFSESVVRSNETLTMSVIASDPAGGTVSIAPAGDLSGNWSIGSSGGLTATATFTFTPTLANAGTHYNVTLNTTLSSTGSTITNVWSVYVPTAVEQHVCISEILVTPTTDTNSPAFNPLKRASDTNNVRVNDEYIELANTSGANVDLFNWTVGSDSGVLNQFVNGGAAEGGLEDLPPGGAVVVYGGPLNGSTPNLPVLSEPANPTPAALTSLAGGILTLHNGSGYLVDRVSYPASSTVPAVGSLSRFPTINDVLVPQAYINTNLVTPGLQYDGGSWGSPTKRPGSLLVPITVTAGNPLRLGFTAGTNLATTLWRANELSNNFDVIFGQQFSNTSGLFFVTNPPPPHQFYFITVQ